MPRIAYHQHVPASARATPEFFALRDEFRGAGMELFANFYMRVYEVHRGRDVLATFATLTAARRWLKRMG